MFNLPLVQGDEGEVQLVLRLEHDLLVRDLQQGRGSERGAQTEQGQGGFLVLLVLPVKHLDLAPDIQTLETSPCVQEAAPLIFSRPIITFEVWLF